MSTLNARAQVIRQSAASALDDQRQEDVVQRSVVFAAKVGQAANRVRQSQSALRTLVDLKIVRSSAHAPSDRRLRNLVAKAETSAPSLAEFIQSGLPGDLELAASEYATALENAAKEAWREYASERAASVGAASELLEKALGSIPRFVETIETTRRARVKVSVLKARELPSTEEIEEFQANLEALEAVNEELEREVPPQFKDTLRRCATRTGVSPNDLPDGFLDWIEKVGARTYFKVTLSDL